MKVIVKKRTRRIPSGKIRMIKFDKEATNEVIWEFLCENKNRLFDLIGLSDSEMCVICDDTTGIRTCIVYNHGEFEKIDFKMLEDMGVNIENTLFSSKTSYKEIKL